MTSLESIPGLGMGDVEADDDSHDEAVDCDQHVPGEIDPLGHPIPPNEAPGVGFN